MNLVENEIIDTVSKSIGKIAKPEVIHITRDLPKTRSGKIMRRILRKYSKQRYSKFRRRDNFS